ncbi:MAG: DUF3576 domain-containing protein [Pseudomonadota bacterium]
MLARRAVLFTVGLVSAAALTACSSNANTTQAEDNGFLGIGRILPGGGDGVVANTPDAGIGVNTFLWRATLETLSFMPLEEVDPFGGVIITDWYANPEQPTERFKATVFILDSRLRADALSVQLFKQVRGEAGDWMDAAVDPATRIQIENAVLTRARQLRISQLD